MTRLFALITAARADFLQHQEPESVHWLADLVCGGSLVGLLLFAVVAIQVSK